MKHGLFTAFAIVATATPAPSQTLLDKLVQRISRPRTTTAAKPSPAATAQLTSATSTVAAFPLDVAGVRLGMSPDDARAALAKAGYRVTGTPNYGPSFASGVRAEAERRRIGSYGSASMADRVLTGLEAAGPNRETILMRLAAVPAGSSVVTEVTLIVPPEVMNGAALLRQAVAKYGPPDGSRDGRLTLGWCSVPVKSVCTSIAPFQVQYGSLPNLTASAIIQNTITLSEGSDRGRDRDREFNAAVERVAPKTDRAAF